MDTATKVGAGVAGGIGVTVIVMGIIYLAYLKPGPNQSAAPDDQKAVPNKQLPAPISASDTMKKGEAEKSKYSAEDIKLGAEIFLDIMMKTKKMEEDRADREAKLANERAERELKLYKKGREDGYEDATKKIMEKMKEEKKSLEEKPGLEGSAKGLSPKQRLVLAGFDAAQQKLKAEFAQQQQRQKANKELELKEWAYSRTVVRIPSSEKYPNSTVYDVVSKPKPGYKEMYDNEKAIFASQQLEIKLVFERNLVLQREAFIQNLFERSVQTTAHNR